MEILLAIKQKNTAISVIIALKYFKMPMKFEEVELDETYTAPDTNYPHPPQKVSKATNSVQNRRGFCHQVHSVITDPIFIEIVVVLLVILSAIASSELGIYVGKSYDNAHGRQNKNVLT